MVMKTLGLIAGLALVCPVGFLVMAIWWEATLTVLLVAAVAGLAAKLAA